MKTLKSSLVIFLLIIGTISCNEELIMLAPNAADYVLENETLKAATKLKKATGSVEIIWKGGGKKSEMGNQPENLRAFFEFNAHESKKAPYSKGEIVFKVTAQDLTLNREIRAKVLAINFCEDENRSWFVAEVISDSKGCSGGPGGEGHESGCSGEDHPDGGCGEDTEHDGGCSGHETTASAPGEETDEGGCAVDHTTDEEVCSISDADIEGGHKPDVTGSAGKGNPLSGKNCRIGQIIVVKVYDKATPGADGDEITWKWFAPNSTYDIIGDHRNIKVNGPNVHLCPKTIIGGNLVVHK